MLRAAARRNPRGHGERGKRRRRRMKDQARARAVQLAFVVLVIGAWFAVGRSGAVSPLLLPRIEAVVDAFILLVQTNQFWSAVGITFGTIVRAYLIAVVLGILTGYFVTRSRFATRLLEPLISG